MRSILLFILLFTTPLLSEQIAVHGPTHGFFTKKDPVLRGLKWGNWGSRPYEYQWASHVVQVKGKKVIDLGVGLPSLYNWFGYVVKKLQPAFYVGVDWDPDMAKEEIVGPNYELRSMSMANLAYPDQEFDVAYCISTFEHIPYDIFMKSIQEAHRVLKPEGLLVVTLDERWDANLPYTNANSWNDLERSLVERGLFHSSDGSSFGMSDFYALVSEYFVPYEDQNIPYERKTNRNPLLLNSGDLYNSCVSFALLKKKAV